MWLLCYTTYLTKRAMSRYKKVAHEQRPESPGPLEAIEQRAAALKARFTLPDYMSCPETKEMLEIEHHNKYADVCESMLHDWYLGKCDVAARSLSSALRYDPYGTQFGVLSALVYKHIKKEYDLELFEFDPNLAEPLLQQYEAIKKAEEEERLRRRRERRASGDHEVRTFDWSSRSYK